nr:predicted GPI-anchored protein 58 [Aegilops tauschii subsp. strangulata]
MEGNEPDAPRRLDHATSPDCLPISDAVVPVVLSTPHCPVPYNPRERTPLLAVFPRMLAPASPRPSSRAPHRALHARARPAPALAAPRPRGPAPAFRPLPLCSRAPRRSP